MYVQYSMLIIFSHNFMSPFSPSFPFHITDSCPSIVLKSSKFHI